jgi:hypothetical protein
VHAALHRVSPELAAGFAMNDASHADAALAELRDRLRGDV